MVLKEKHKYRKDKLTLFLHTLPVSLFQTFITLYIAGFTLVAKSPQHGAQFLIS